MALRGDLASVDLAQVFQMLALNKKVGLLSIQSVKLWKVLYFDQRGVTLSHNVHAVLDRAVAAFVRSTRLTPEAVDEVREHAARTGQGLADSLLAGGYVAAEELEAQYQAELEEEIYDLFFCREAKFEFYEGATTLEGRDDVVDERFFFNCDSVIMEAARRIDEWAYISERVPTTAAVFVATADSIDGARFGADGAALFELLDGRRNVARIVGTTGLSNFQVCKVISQMIEAGVAAPMDNAELLPLAAECMAEGRLQDAISLYERAVALEVGLPDVHSRAAKAYQAAEEYEHGIYHLECEAELRVDAGDLAGAARLLLEVRHLVPTDLQARHRLVELTLGANAPRIEGFDPMVEGKELVDLLMEFGDIQRVRALLEQLLLVAPNDPDLKKALVNVHVKAGDQGRVVELYESIANDFVRLQKPLEAVGYLQKILLIDRSRADISERVRKLYEFDERSRRRTRTRSVLGVLFCLLLVVGSGYWVYNDRAEEAFGRLDASEMLAREDFAGARSMFEEFMLSCPLTTAAGRAEAELRQIEAKSLEFEARRASERAARDREMQQMRADYGAAWQQHRQLFLGGQPEAAMRALTQVRELVAKTAAVSDLVWANEQHVERTWVRLRDFLAESARLFSEYEVNLQAGDWQAARERALRLLTEFENTQGARQVMLPVQLVTRPAGAQLEQQGESMTRLVDGVRQPMRTPAVVLCSPRAPLGLTARLEGFSPREVAVDGRKAAQVEVVLEVVANRRISFDVPAQTGVGLGDGWLAVGLRGGRLGVARLDGTQKKVHVLGELKAVDSTPIVEAGRVFFTTNENTVESLPISSPEGGWIASVPSGCATDLMVGAGRVAVVDRDGVVRCFEQSTGRQAWSVALGSAPSGPPTLDRRQICVGTADGRVLVIDAADGTSISVLRSPVPLTTRVLCDRSVIWFGGADGNVRAVDLDEGRVLWTRELGRTPVDGDLAISRSALLALAADNTLIAIDRASGEIVRRVVLEGEVRHGLRVARSRAFALVQRPKTRTRAVHDVLIQIDVETMCINWEYAEATTCPGLPALDDSTGALPTMAGEVILFR